jgi:hypothetical protein
MRIIYFVRNYVRSTRIMACLFVMILVLTVIAHSMYSSSHLRQSISDKNRTTSMARSSSKGGAMLDKQRIYFTAAHLTKSLKISSASYVENELQLKNKAGAIVFSGARRDYQFTFNNLSSNIIDSILIVFKKKDVIKRINDEFYDELGGLQPQGSSEIRVTGVDPDWTPSVEAIIFRDYTYEGNPVLAEARIVRFKAKNDKISELMALFTERNLLSIDDDKVIRNNVDEIRTLIEEERESNKPKTSYRDTQEFETYSGKSDGVLSVHLALNQLEQNPNRYGMRNFIHRVTERTKK